MIINKKIRKSKQISFLLFLIMILWLKCIFGITICSHGGIMIL